MVHFFKKSGWRQHIARIVAVVCVAAALGTGFAAPAYAASVTAEAAPVTASAATQQIVQITGTPVNVRTGAGTSYKRLGRTSKGKTYFYLGSKTVNGVTWYKIQYTYKRAGWVMAKFAKRKTVTDTTSSTTVSSSTQQIVQITGTTVNVRTGAGTSYSRLGRTSKGKTYFYLSSKTVNGVTWYKIQYTYKRAGWIMAKFAKRKTVVETAASTASTTATTTTTAPTTTTTTAAVPTSSVAVTRVQVKGNNVNVRAAAGTSGSRLGSTSTGDTYPYLGSQTVSGKVWYKIQYTDTQIGWISGDYSAVETVTTIVTAVTTPSTATTASAPAETPVFRQQVEVIANDVNVRSGAGTANSAVGKAATGDVFDYLGSKLDSQNRVWFQVQYTDSQKGWLLSQYARLKVVTQTTATTAAPATTTTTAASSTTTTTTKATTTTTKATTTTTVPATPTPAPRTTTKATTTTTTTAKPTTTTTAKPTTTTTKATTTTTIPATPTPAPRTTTTVHH